MISLRKTMEMQVEDLVQSTLDAYLSAIAAMSEAGVRACPPTGNQLREGLSRLHGRLSIDPTPCTITETERELEQELTAWSTQSSQFLDEKTDEVKEILNLVATATREVSERDERHSKRFRQLTDRLSATAKLNDLSAIKQSLHHSVEDLKNSVSKMTQDTQESVTQLRAKLTIYQTRLEEVERIAFLDPLTGVANRRMVERQFELRTSSGCPFSLIYVDLNDFKRINDRYGHMAGDSLLKQYAAELRSAFRPTDLVGRVGGDEFVVLMEGELHEAATGLERIAKYVNGEYKIDDRESEQIVTVTASSGAAEWLPGLLLIELLKAADEAMYANKPRTLAVR